MTFDSHNDHEEMGPHCVMVPVLFIVMMCVYLSKLKKLQTVQAEMEYYYQSL